jgi:hypothetical protein
MLDASISAFTNLQAAPPPIANGHRFRLFRGGDGREPRPDPTGQSSARHVALARELDISIRKRDFLVHSFFRSPNCQRLLKTEDGRRALVRELGELADEFRHWADALAPAVLAYAVAQGRTSRDQLRQRVDALALVSDGSALAAQTQAALEMDPQAVEEMVQVLRELGKLSPTDH